MQPLHPREGGRKSRYLQYLPLGGVEAGHHRNANHQILSRRGYFFGVFQNQLVGYTGKKLVLFPVSVLDIHQIKVQIGQYLFRNHPERGQTGGLHGRVDPPLMGGLHQRRRKVRLHQRFPAGQGEPAAGAPVVKPVLHHFVQDLSNGDIPADSLRLSPGDHGLDFPLLGFRIAAPPAPQGTAL